MTVHDDLPPITVSTNDYNRLMITATLAGYRGSPHAGFLLSELRRANVCHPDDLDEDIVSTNCRVIYRLDGGPRTYAHLLVHPDDLMWPGAEVSVLTPLGIALLGLRAGDRMSYRATESGPSREVLVEGVGFRFRDDGLSWRPDRAPAAGRYDWPTADDAH